jgi:uncharacterized Zn finger protein
MRHTSIEQEIAEDNPCPECGSINQDVRLVASRNWYGWIIECLECGEMAEKDEPEEPAEHRSV